MRVEGGRVREGDVDKTVTAALATVLEPSFIASGWVHHGQLEAPADDITLTAESWVDAGYTLLH